MKDQKITWILFRETITIDATKWRECVFQYNAAVCN